MAKKETTTKTEAPKGAMPQKVKRVAVKIPRAERGEENFITASVNGEVFKMKKGEIVEVPTYIAEVLATQEAEIIKSEEYAEGLNS